MHAIDQVIHDLAAVLKPTAIERVAWQECLGRVLAQPLVAERESPAMDVSAMDGFAIRLADLARSEIPVGGIVQAGMEAQPLVANCCSKIFTGAVVPANAELVIRREDVDELQGAIRIKPGLRFTHGDNIRRRGENGSVGTQLMLPGTRFHQASFSAIAASGMQQMQVYRNVSVAIINTGDELLGMEDQLQPWQIRDSNGPTLEFLLRQIPWVNLVSRYRVKDALEAIRAKLDETLQLADAVLLTGGVSMGDTDFVPQAIRDVGGRIVFHRIPIRPGKPILGAATRDGKLILGLPGNPVSVAVTSLRLGAPLLRKLAGIQEILTPPMLVSITNSDCKSIPLTWYRLGQVVEAGKVKLVESQGSGDLISLAKSDGFVEVPPNTSGAGPYPWYAWTNL